jgi:hypothetical protein
MPSQLTTRQVRQIWRRMVMVFIGVLMFIIGVYPNLIGLNLSPQIGFVQVGVWLIGLGLILLGAYLVVRVVRAGRQNSLRADIGVRLMATAYVVAMVSSLADYIGIGSQYLGYPSFGPVQVVGLAVGVVVSILGLVMYWPGRGDEGDPERESGS